MIPVPQGNKQKASLFHALLQSKVRHAFKPFSIKRKPVRKTKK